MTERQSVLLLRALNWTAIAASLVWIAVIGGIELVLTTTFWNWLGDRDNYSVQGALWFEANLYWPVALLWLIVFGIGWIVQRRTGAASVSLGSVVKNSLLDAQLLLGQCGFWILVAFSVVWPSTIQIPGLLDAVGLDSDRVRALPAVAYMAMFIAPPLLLAAVLIVWERGRIRLRKGNGRVRS